MDEDRPTYFYRYPTDAGIGYCGMSHPIDRPDFEEITEAEFYAYVASLAEPEPSDEATEEDLLAALTELGVIS